MHPVMQYFIIRSYVYECTRRTHIPLNIYIYNHYIHYIIHIPAKWLLSLFEQLRTRYVLCICCFKLNWHAHHSNLPQYRLTTTEPAMMCFVSSPGKYSDTMIHHATACASHMFVSIYLFVSLYLFYLSMQQSVRWSIFFINLQFISVVVLSIHIHISSYFYPSIHPASHP